MPISKQKLKELAQSLQGGVLSNGLTESADKSINRIVEKLHAKLFPKGSSVEAREVESRLESILGVRGIDRCGAPYAIPLSTIKVMVRKYAGDVKVPDDTLALLCGALQVLIKTVMLEAAREIKDSVAVLDAKHIKASMEGRGGNAQLASVIAGARAKRSSSKKRRSSSKKRRSSKKKCGRGKSPVKAFSRDGKRVKSYCRKKSTSR